MKTSDNTEYWLEFNDTGEGVYTGYILIELDGMIDASQFDLIMDGATLTGAGSLEIEFTAYKLKTKDIPPNDYD